VPCLNKPVLESIVGPIPITRYITKGQEPRVEGRNGAGSVCQGDQLVGNGGSFWLFANLYTINCIAPDLGDNGKVTKV
jgi:hypothetical protein